MKSYLSERISFVLVAISAGLLLVLTPLCWQSFSLNPAGFLNYAQWILLMPCPGPGVLVGALFCSHLKALCFGALLLLGSLGGGLLLAGRQNRPRSWGEVAEGALLCLGGWGISVFLLYAMRLGALVLPLFLLLFAPLTILLVIKMRKSGLKLLRPSSPWEWWILLPVLVCVLFSLFSALAPVHQSDALAYHALVPNAYAKAGYIVAFPYSIRAHFPMLGQMSSCAGFSASIESASRMVHMVYYLLGLIVLFDLARLVGGRRGAVLALGGWVALPTVPTLATYGFVDLAVVAFFVAVLRRGLLMLREGSGSRLCWLKFGLLAGMAVAAKLSIGLALLPLAIAGVVLAVRKLLTRAAIVSLLIAGCASILPVLPWLVNNGLQTGNPFLPFLSKQFTSQDWTPGEAEIYSEHAQSKGQLLQIRSAGLAERALDLLMLPLRSTLSLSSSHPCYRSSPNRHFGDWPIGPWALAFLPILLLPLLWRDQWRGCAMGLALLVVLLFIWQATYRDNRFLLPALALYMILLAYATAFLKDSVARLWRWCSAMAVVAGIAMGMLLCLNSEAAFYSMGSISRDNFLRIKVPESFSEGQTWLRTHLKPGEKALFVGLNQTYFQDFACETNDFFSAPVLLRLACGADSVPQLEERLRENGYTHLVFFGDTLASSGYQYWFLKHFLSPVTREKMELQGGTALEWAHSSAEYRLIGSWLTLSQELERLKQVYPESKWGGAERDMPWGLPRGMLILHMATCKGVEDECE
jgi:4-amino-4-deoxy-L-arabinose transferase-like glycosyltransferase